MMLRNHMIRTIIAGAIIVISGVTVFANGQREEPAAGEDEQITLTLWFGRENFVPHDEFEQFHEENPNIRVEWDVVPLEQAHTDFLRNRASGNAPDVVQIFHEFTATMVAQGALMDISDHLSAWKADDPEDFADIYDIAFDLTSYRNGTYGINVHSGPYFMGYRKDWLEEAGLGEPESWSELVEIMRVLQRDYLDPNEYAFAQPGGAHHPPFWFNSIYMSMGGQFTETGLPIIDSEAGRAIIRFFQTLAAEDLQNPAANSWASGDFRGAFIGGRAAFFPEANNVFAQVRNELEYGVEWDAMVQPPRRGAEDDFRVNSFGWPYMVSADTEHPETVMKVLRYIFRPDIAIDVAVAYQPVNRKSVMGSDEYLEAHPYYAKLEEAFAEQVPYPTHLRSVERSDILNQLKQTAQTEPDRDPVDIAREYQALLDELEN